MTTQLELTALPTADPAFEAAALLELELELILAAVGSITDDDASSDPTARNLAEHLWCEGEESAPWGGELCQRALALLVELELRGAVTCFAGICSYFSRDDEPADVIRWVRVRRPLPPLR